MNVIVPVGGGHGVFFDGRLGMDDARDRRLLLVLFGRTYLHLAILHRRWRLAYLTGVYENAVRAMQHRAGDAS